MHTLIVQKHNYRGFSRSYNRVLTELSNSHLVPTCKVYAEHLHVTENLNTSNYFHGKPRGEWISSVNPCGCNHDVPVG